MRREKNVLKKMESALWLFIIILGIHACSKSNSSTSTTTATVDLTHLLIGDSKILRKDKGQSLPAIGYLWLCGVPANGNGNSNAKDWTNSDGSWDFTKKPTVDGSVTWTSILNISLDGLGNRMVTGNGLPNHPTGVFPIAPTSTAYKYDGNPNPILAQTINYTFLAIPKVATSPTCVGYGISGISLSGGAIYHGASTLANDAAVYEMLDNYGGQSDGTNTYHYHYLTDNLKNLLDTSKSGHSSLMGYMKDGFGIYGPRGEDGKVLASKDLDECHGHTHSVLWDGQMVNLYHYHWTYDFPYNIGCYKGTPK